MGEAVTVRPAGPADAGAIAAVRVRTWRVAHAGILPADALAELDEAADAARRRCRLEAGGSSWALVASIGDPPGVAGFAFAGPPRGADVPPGAGEIYAVHVVPEAQGHGAGRALVNETLHGLCARGHAAAFFWVLEANAPARRFYEALGFALTAGATTSRWAGRLSPRSATGPPLTAPAIRPPRRGGSPAVRPVGAGVRVTARADGWRPSRPPTGCARSAPGARSDALTGRCARSIMVGHPPVELPRNPGSPAGSFVALPC